MKYAKAMNCSKVILSKIVVFVAILLLQVFTPVSAAAADTQLPTVPAGLSVVNVTHTSVSLCWTAAHDDTKVKGYQVFRDGKKIKSTPTTSFTNVNLVPGRKYTYSIKAYDAEGNTSDYSSSITAVTADDLQNPVQPSGLAVLSVSYTSITVSWNASSDNISVKGYEVYCNEKKVSATSSTYYALKGLIPGQSYSFYIKAYDAAGNYSVKSNSITASAACDNVAPSVPAGLKASSVTHTEIALAWSPSSDNVKVKNYEVFCNGIRLSSTTKTSFCNKKLVPGKCYVYTVRALDSSGNFSANSNSLKISSIADIESPSAPSGLKVKSATRSSASLSWNASTDNTKVKGYQIFCNGFMIAETTKTHYTAKSPFRLGIDIFYVKAFDIVNNMSASSSKVTVITLK